MLACHTKRRSSTHKERFVTVDKHLLTGITISNQCKARRAQVKTKSKQKDHRTHNSGTAGWNVSQLILPFQLAAWSCDTHDILLQSLDKTVYSQWEVEGNSHFSWALMDKMFAIIDKPRYSGKSLEVHSTLEEQVTVLMENNNRQSITRGLQRKGSTTTLTCYIKTQKPFFDEGTVHTLTSMIQVMIVCVHRSQKEEEGGKKNERKSFFNFSPSSIWGPYWEVICTLHVRI